MLPTSSKENYIESFACYLKEKRYSKASTGDYTRYINRFIDWLKEENISVESCKHRDLLSFVKQCKSLNYSTKNINGHLRGIRYFYEHLKKEGITTHNPASVLYLKGETKRLPHDLLSKEFLQEIAEGYNAETPVQKRNKIILSLIINQALRREELERLESKDIDLYKGIIHIRPSLQTKKLARNSERILKLTSEQILPLHEYINAVRAELLKIKGSPSEKLFITIGTSSKIQESLREFLRELKKKHPALKDFMHIRMSVISHWLKEKNIRQVQYMAGHGHILSTEAYKKVNLKTLHQALTKYHPMR